MTSQSPRIYLYKITFEEVSYYYYGIHKEKNFNEYYMGSPKTHKWCWDFYTPKKQILQFFDFTDDGWLEAQEVEKRLIKPFFNTDKWCLNESCGGIVSLEVLRKTGRKNGEKIYELGVGIFSLTPEQRSENSKKSGKLGGKKVKELRLGFFSLTPEQNIEKSKKGGTKSKELGVGIHALTPEQRSENSKVIAQKNRENNVGVYGFTTEERRENVKITNSQKWICLETGYITTSAGLTHYQKARGIDTSKRKQIS
jgi:hypothetical protein